MTPQLLLTLSPSGELQIERYLNGMRQKIDIKPGSLEATAKRILHAQLERECKLGQDGLPTESQIRHWERHNIFPDDRCPHCLSEGLTHKQRHKIPSHAAGNGSVRVRHLPSRSSGRRLSSHKSADQLGL